MALLELKEISKEYSGKKVLDTVSLKIQSGEMKVVMGPSGCGKTTLLRCLIRLEESDHGDIYFHGKNIYDKEFNILEFRKKSVVSSRITLCIAILMSWIILPLPYVKCLTCRDNVPGRKPYMSYKNLICYRIARNTLRSYRAGSNSVSPWPVQWPPTQN